jgi:cation:H+ antiporter
VRREGWSASSGHARIRRPLPDQRAVSVALAAIGFVLSAAVTLWAAAIFAKHLDSVAIRLGMADALLGLLTALAADGPEVASAVTALVRGEHQVGVGVVVGSNAFNLAAMIGGGAIAAGRIRARPASLRLEAVMAAAALAAAGGVVTGVVGPWPALAALTCVLVPYVWLVARSDDDAGHPAHPREADHPLARALAVMAAGLIGIVVGSVVMVDTALVVADHVGVSRAFVGIVVLGVLTSLPNAYTAIRLARMQRGDATVSETMNSNTINLVAGVLIPAVVLGAGAVASGGGTLAGVAVMTAVTLAFLVPRRGIGAGGGAVLIALYAVFVALALR